MSFLFMKERVDTSDGILAVANFVRQGRKQPLSLKKSTPTNVDTYEVYLPSSLDGDTANYAEFLLDNPHPKVKLHYKREDLGGGGARAL